MELQLFAVCLIGIPGSGPSLQGVKDPAEKSVGQALAKSLSDGETGPLYWTLHHP